MPDARNDKNERDIYGPETDAASPQRHVDVIPKPLTQSYVPSPPELDDARRTVWTEEIQSQPDPQAACQAHGDQAVPREIVINPQAEQKVRLPDQEGI